MAKLSLDLLDKITIVMSKFPNALYISEFDVILYFVVSKDCSLFIVTHPFNYDELLYVLMNYCFLIICKNIF